MDINKDLLSLTIKKSINQIKTGTNDRILPSVGTSEGRNINISAKPLSITDTLTIGGKTVDVMSVLSDEAVEKMMDEATGVKSASSLQAISYKELDQKQIQQIKEVIYNIHNGIEYGKISNWNTTTIYEDKSGYNYAQKTINLNDFSQDFKNADEIFEYVNKKYETVTKETGIPQSILVALSQDDSYEDSHRDFFGSLNRVFQNCVAQDYSLYTNSLLDIDNDAYVISYDELASFLERADSDENETLTYEEFKTAVEEFSNKLQKTYDQLTTQDKLEWSIVKTREYLEAMGMTAQLDALDRLLEGTDTHRSEHIAQVGQIALADCNPKGINDDGMTEGAYQFYAYDYVSNNESIRIWAGDEDNNNDDSGIVLDYRLTEKIDGYQTGDWFTLVNTLVHELTHATAYQYYDDDAVAVMVSDYYIEKYNPEHEGLYTTRISIKGIQQLYDIGALSSDNYQYYSTVNMDKLYRASELVDTVYYEELTDTNGNLIIDDKTYDLCSNGNNPDKVKEIALKLKNCEYISSDEYDNIIEEITEYSNKLLFLQKTANTAWGEYRAYQADADYMDSIAGDVFDPDVTTAVDGAKEKTKISEHIDDMYNDPTPGDNYYVEPVPNWKWWSFA